MPELTRSGSPLATAAPEVAKIAARHADSAEDSRLPAHQSMRAIVEAGFARHFVPVEYGGRAAGFQELNEPLATIGAACPATAWCAALTASLPRMAAALPAAGREAIWAAGPDTLVVGAVSPRGRAHRRGEGWLLSGTWPFVSAIDYSEWALVLGLVPGPAGGRPEPRFFALPRADFGVEATWFDIGMRATGSNTLVADDVYVPDVLSCPAAELLAGRAPGAAAACHTVPLAAANGLTFCLPMLGGARGALAHWSALAAPKATSKPGPGPAPGFYQETLARASGAIDAAEMLLARVAACADKGAEITPLETARNQRDCAFAADLLVTVVDQLFRASGTSGHSMASPLQRLWRDVHSAASHIVLQFGPAAAAYADRVFAADGGV